MKRQTERHTHTQPKHPAGCSGRRETQSFTSAGVGRGVHGGARPSLSTLGWPRAPSSPAVWGDVSPPAPLLPLLITTRGAPSRDSRSQAKNPGNREHVGRTPLSAPILFHISIHSSPLLLLLLYLLLSSSSSSTYSPLRRSALLLFLLYLLTSSVGLGPLQALPGVGLLEVQ